LPQMQLRSTEGPDVVQPATDTTQPEKADPPNIQILVECLRSDDFKTRQQATEKLFRLAPVYRSIIENSLASESDPEAAARLTVVAQHLFLKDPRYTPLLGRTGFMGIALQVEPQFGQGAADEPRQIVVLETKPGFPAYEVLKPDDRILAIEGHPIPEDYSIDDFRGTVGAKRPGSFMNLTVLRQGKKFQASVRLAGLEAPGDTSIARFIELRTFAAKNYLENLHTGPSSKPMIIKDNTPPGNNNDDALSY